MAMGSKWQTRTGASAATLGVKQALRTREKQPLICEHRSGAGGDAGNRTRIHGFAGRCLSHSATSPLVTQVTGHRKTTANTTRIRGTSRAMFEPPSSAIIGG